MFGTNFVHVLDLFAVCVFFFITAKVQCISTGHKAKC